jgi:uncharacterized protein (DUF169 family)
MDNSLKNRFINLWQKYFTEKETELPLVFYYTKNRNSTPPANKPDGHRCLIAELARVRNGKSLAFNQDNIGCGGGKRHSGFSEGLSPDFEYFLSCGKEGVVEGERYKKDPGTVKAFMEDYPQIDAKDNWLIFKRWDKLEESDNPEVVIFFAEPDVISGLFTLANYDRTDENGVKTPMGAGCSSIILHPYQEKKKANPCGIIGMFDISARPFVPANKLTFAVPFERFKQLIDYMEESFLITNSWDKIKDRIE